MDPTQQKNARGCCLGRDLFFLLHAVDHPDHHENRERNDRAHVCSTYKFTTDNELRTQRREHIDGMSRRNGERSFLGGILAACEAVAAFLRFTELS